MDHQANDRYENRLLKTGEDQIVGAMPAEASRTYFPTHANHFQHSDVSNEERVWPSARWTSWESEILSAFFLPRYGQTSIMCSSSGKNHWSADEDAALRSLIEQYGARDWAKIAGRIPGRNGKQCHQRWTYFLDPDVRNGVWTEDEDREIVRLQSRLGNKWAKIALHMPGRTGHAVKNRFISLTKLNKRPRRSKDMSSWTGWAMAGGSTSSEDMGKMWPKSSSMHVPHGSHHAAPASASSAFWAQHHMESYTGQVPSQPPSQTASAHVMMGSAQFQASDMHPQQYQMPSLASQQMQSAQHMHSTHHQLLERHQYETPKYPWHDYHGCPVDVEPFHHVEPPQLSHQPIPPNAPMVSMPMGHVPMGDYECHAPIRRQPAPMHAPGTDVQSCDQHDELDAFYKHQFPVLPLKTFLAQEEGPGVPPFGRQPSVYSAANGFEHASADHHESN